MNEEEKKMGIKGSSTRQVFFNDTPVPIENILSERENGFKIAVNILNVGRIKLAASAVGASKRVITTSVNYANERQQFNVPISSFGAIQHKIDRVISRKPSASPATGFMNIHLEEQKTIINNAFE